MCKQDVCKLVILSEEVNEEDSKFKLASGVCYYIITYSQGNTTLISNAAYSGMLTSPGHFVSAMNDSNKSRADKMALYCKMSKLAFSSLKSVDQTTIDKFSVLLQHCTTITTLDCTGDIMKDEVKTMAGEMLLGITTSTNISQITTDCFTLDEDSTSIILPDSHLRPPGAYLFVLPILAFAP